VTSDRVISILFMIGSACFALRAVPGYASAARADGVTFFAGSLFFTAAVFGQFLQSRRTATRRRRDAAWWAAIIQLAGTVLFNASTLRALAASLSAAGPVLPGRCYLLLPRPPARQPLAVGGAPAAR
jgi:Mn2+/Fe2+ NRAMP family transporter